MDLATAAKQAVESVTGNSVAGHEVGVQRNFDAYYDNYEEYMGCRDNPIRVTVRRENFVGHATIATQLGDDPEYTVVFVKLRQGYNLALVFKCDYGDQGPADELIGTYHC